MDTLGAVSAVFRAAPALSVYNGAQIKVISAEMGAYFIGSLAQLKKRLVCQQNCILPGEKFSVKHPPFGRVQERTAAGG